MIAGTAPQVAAQTPYQTACLCVRDLPTEGPDEATEGLLFELFSRAGPVSSIRIKRCAISRRSLGYAYVAYVNRQDAERALDTITDVKGKACRIVWSDDHTALKELLEEERQEQMDASYDVRENES
jgi:polyadenylate-binding protein